jgi:predicted nucleotidyltransferase
MQARGVVMANAQTVSIPDRIRDIAERIKTAYGAERVILYGSYARGEATEDSDIDLLVVARTEEGFLDRMAAVRAAIRDLRRGMPISPIVVTPDELEDHNKKGRAFVQVILEEGIDL